MQKQGGGEGRETYNTRDSLVVTGLSMGVQQMGLRGKGALSWHKPVKKGQCAPSLPLTLLVAVMSAGLGREKLQRTMHDAELAGVVVPHMHSSGKQLVGEISSFRFTQQQRGLQSRGAGSARWKAQGGPT